QRWNQMRAWGPTDSRWDPQPEPPGDYPGAAVTYATPDVATAFGAAFQDRRAITLSGGRTLAGWTPVRTLRLLDLTDTWAVRNQASTSLDSAPKSTCRAWARVIHDTWPSLDGMRARSTMTGRPIVVLFAPAADSYLSGPT